MAKIRHRAIEQVVGIVRETVLKIVYLQSALLICLKDISMAQFCDFAYQSEYICFRLEFRGSYFA